MTTTILKTGLQSYEISLLVNRGQRAFNGLLKTCLAHNQLTVSEWALLGQLSQQATLRPTEIASLLGVKGPFVTKIMETLAAKGHIEYLDSPDDDRGKRIQLTTKGMKKVEIVEAKLQVCIEHQLGDLRNQQLATYFQVCDYISNNVRHH